MKIQYVGFSCQPACEFFTKPPFLVSFANPCLLKEIFCTFASRSRFLLYFFALSRFFINHFSFHHFLRFEILFLFFGGLQCVGHSFAYVAQLRFLNSNPELCRARYRLNPSHLAIHLSYLATHPSHLATHRSHLAIHPSSFNHSSLSFSHQSLSFSHPSLLFSHPSLSFSHPSLSFSHPSPFF